MQIFLIILKSLPKLTIRQKVNVIHLTECRCFYFFISSFFLQGKIIYLREITVELVFGQMQFCQKTSTQPQQSLTQNKQIHKEQFQCLDSSPVNSRKYFRKYHETDLGKKKLKGKQFVKILRKLTSRQIWLGTFSQHNHKS